MNDLTQDYVKVYQHLAEGVQTLGNSRSFHNLLEQQPGKVVLTVDDDGKARAPVDYAAADAAAEPASPAAAAAEAAAGEAEEERIPTAIDETGPDRPGAAEPVAGKVTDDEAGGSTVDKAGEAAADAGEERPAAQTGPEDSAGASKSKA